MSFAPDDDPSFVADDALIEEAANRLDVSGRLEGSHGLLLLDVALPAETLDSHIRFLALAAIGLHHEIQDDDELDDIQETLEDAARDDDQIAIDEGCDRYRSLLASRLKATLARSDGPERLAALQRAGREASRS